MEDIGKTLQETRKQQKKTLEDVFDDTRVNIEHLRLLEANDFSFLPETYVKSFIKTYATSLGLDANEILDAYRARQEEAQKDAAESEAVEVVEDESVTRPAPAAPAKHLPPSGRVIEYALGIGSLLFLAGLLFVYIQYRSQIYAAPIDELSYRQNHDYLDFADIRVNTPDREGSKSSEPIELEVSARDNIRVALTIDNDETTETTLAPKQKMVWLAQDRIDLQLWRVQPRARLQSTPVSDSVEAVVRLSFAKPDVHD